MLQRASRWAQHLWLLPAIIFLLLAIGSLGPSSYFLHLDTADQNLIAADLADACLGTGSSKPGVALILTPFFLVGGDSPYWEPLVVTLFGALTVAMLYRLYKRVTGSGQWAMLGVLWFISLPTILYYTRIHMSHPLVLYVAGLWLYSQRRYPLAALAFGATAVTHVNFLLPIGAWVAWSFLLGERPGRVRTVIEMALLFLLPWLFVESLYFFFNGMVFGWSRGIWADITRISGSYKGGDWLDVLHVIVFANGPINALLLFVGIFYPLVRHPRVRLMDVAYGAGFLTVGFWILNSGLTGGAFRHRMIAGAYPLLVMLSAFTIMRLARLLSERLNAPARSVVRFAGVSVVVILLPWTIINHTLDALASSRTAHKVIDRTMAEAAEAGLPVRYYGNIHTSRFLARRNQVEMAFNETSLDVIKGDTRAVLIFEDVEQATLAALRADPEFDESLYEVSAYPHFIAYRPHTIEDPVTADQIRAFRQRAYARQPGSLQSQAEIWWPLNPSGTFEARHVVQKDSQVFILHYPGSGCVSLKRFDGDSKNYYDILFARTRSFAQAVAAGDFAAAREQVRSALGDGKIGTFEVGTGEE